MRVGDSSEFQFRGRAPGQVRRRLVIAQTCKSKFGQTGKPARDRKQNTASCNPRPVRGRPPLATCKEPPAPPVGDPDNTTRHRRLDPSPQA